jgi:predicted GTPase
MGHIEEIKRKATEKPILFLINKMDKMKDYEASYKTLESAVRDMMIKSNYMGKYSIRGCSAITGVGVKEVFDFLDEIMH